MNINAESGARFVPVLLAVLVGFPASMLATTYTTTTFTDFPVPNVNAANGAIIGGAGNGQVSIRSAIMASNFAGGSNIVNLQNGTYTLTQGPYDDEFNAGGGVPETGDLDIIDLQIIGKPKLVSVTINGVARDTTIITMGTLVPASGGISKDRVLEVNDFVNPQVAINVTLNNLTVSGGDAPKTPAPDNYNTPGGGIQYDGFDSATGKNSGVLTLNNCKVTGNQAAGNGGGVHAIFCSAVVQSNGNGPSIVSNNTARFASGGGIQYSGGNTVDTPPQGLSVLDSQVTGNTAADATFGNGGGVDSVGGGKLIITNATISNNIGNEASGFNGGGGLHIGNTAGVVITNSTFDNNVCKFHGGAIWSAARNAVTNAPSTIQLSGVTITNNKADNDNNGTGNGGGIYNYVGALTATNCTIDGNTAAAGAGIFNTHSGNSADAAATASITGGFVRNNIASGNGGGIAADLSSSPASGAGSVTLTKVTIAGNAANGSGQGGGIYNNGATFNGTFNRIALNTSAGASASRGMRNVSGTATMQNNWWGTNTPTTVISGTVNSAPSLQLTHAAASSPICPNVADQLTASFRLNSTSADVSANIDTLLGLPITFGNPLLGTVSNAQTTIQSAPATAKGTATATFTSGTTPGTGHADATVDSFVVTANVSVNQPPTFTNATSTTFKVGTLGSFGLTTTATPAPTITKTAGTLPSGITLTDNHNNTATLAGTPAAGAGGVYALTFGASNTCGSDSQNFSLTINEAPSITSANTVTFTTITAGTFSVTTGPHFPTAETVTQTGALPSGVSFVDNGNGTATISGTPGAGSGGAYPLTITANNGITPNATQSFTLTVNQPPAITSANTVTLTVGTAGSFTVTKTGFPSPTLSVTGTLPSGITFTPGTGALAGTPANGSGGNYPLTFTASNGVGSNATQSFTLVINRLPAATGDALGTFQDKAVHVSTANLISNDSDPDGDPITFLSVTPGGGPNSGTVALSGSTVTYTPKSGFLGTDTFIYTIGDGRGGTTNGTVNVTISPLSSFRITMITKSPLQVSITGQGAPGGYYILQYAPDITAVFQNLSGTIHADASGIFFYNDTTQPQLDRGFYKAIVAP